jgi:RimJ/RimL family protein N-acetyltransferase
MSPPLERLEPCEHRGRHARLAPLDADAHASALHAASHAGDPGSWDFLPYGPFASVQELAAWIREATAPGDPLFFAILTPVPVGVLSLLRWDPANPTVEVGHLWYSAALQRTPAATEAVFLLARHAFEDLRVRRFEWKCNAANARSRRAAERFGFTYEGTFRQHMLVKGRNRDTAWYSLLDREWSAAREAFERWLEPANFDASGRQRRRLEELRAA